MLEQLGRHMYSPQNKHKEQKQNQNFKCYLKPYTKINSKCILKFSVKIYNF